MRRGITVATGYSFESLVKQYLEAKLKDHCRGAALLISALFPEEIIDRRYLAVGLGDWQTVAVIDEIMLAYRPRMKWKTVSSLEDSLKAIRDHFGGKKCPTTQPQDS